MGIVFVDVGMSLDGFIAGPNGRPGNPLGDGGLRIHEWVFPLATFREHIGLTGGETNADDQIVKSVFDRCGAYVMGRRMFDEGEVSWPENAPFRAPVFVVTHHAREPWVRKGGTTFTFVTAGFGEALRRAKEAAGERDVRISGGADVIQQAFRAGVVVELDVHLAPVLLGAGVRLFEGLSAADVKLEAGPVSPSRLVTHLRFRVVG
ncbi:MAG TPA: dihydrofolate reductase family protein [Anaeromyxobacter sp.]